MQTAQQPSSSPLTVAKQQVSEWLLLEEMDKKRRYEERLLALQTKYNTDFDTFEVRVNGAVTEDFAQWDDYLDWQATKELHQALLVRIELIRRGDFQVA